MNPTDINSPTMYKELYYDATLQPTCTSINFTVLSAHQNSLIQQVIITLASPDVFFGSALGITFNDRGNGYPGNVNGYTPQTFASFSTSATIALPSNFVSSETIIQHGNVITINVGQSIQDSEGVGLMYITLFKIFGVFNTSFTMAVIYSPASTYNWKLNNRNNLSDCKTWRVLTQQGVASYNDPTAFMVDQKNQFAINPFPRQNGDITTFGFTISGTSPIFYFGSSTKVSRIYLGFSSDMTRNIGYATFAYWNGQAFQTFSTSTAYQTLGTSQMFIGCGGPGTYIFAQDGIITINGAAVTNWCSLVMPNDPLTMYNKTIVGLGTLATNNFVNNPQMFWIKCFVGFATTTGALNPNSALLTVAAVVPLADPNLPLTYRRKLI